MGPHVAWAGREGWRSREGVEIKKSVKVDRRGWSSEWKNILIEDNMMREDEVVSEEVKAAIPLVVRGVTEEDTTSGPGGFVRGNHEGVAGTTKDQKVGV
jgi:hypothetical protein